MGWCAGGGHGACGGLLVLYNHRPRGMGAVRYAFYALPVVPWYGEMHRFGLFFEGNSHRRGICELRAGTGVGGAFVITIGRGNRRPLPLRRQSSSVRGGA